MLANPDNSYGSVCVFDVNVRINGGVMTLSSDFHLYGIEKKNSTCSCLNLCDIVKLGGKKGPPPTRHYKIAV